MTEEPREVITTFNYWLDKTRDAFQAAYLDTCPLCAEESLITCLKVENQQATYLCPVCGKQFVIDQDKRRLSQIVGTG